MGLIMITASEAMSQALDNNSSILKSFIDAISKASKAGKYSVDIKTNLSKEDLTNTILSLRLLGYKVERKDNNALLGVNWFKE
jgi:hypothetical protein